MNYRFLTPALSELTEAAAYYEEQSAGLGGDFVQEIERSVARILCFPDAWGKIAPRYRHCVLRRFPYAIVYTRRGEHEILIVSVFHLHRRPLSWKRNL